jgi:hypothetical protein
LKFPVAVGVVDVPVSVLAPVVRVVRRPADLGLNLVLPVVRVGLQSLLVPAVFALTLTLKRRTVPLVWGLGSVAGVQKVRRKRHIVGLPS